jgi:hypothetical protein
VDAAEDEQALTLALLHRACLTSTPALCTILSYTNEDRTMKPKRVPLTVSLPPEMAREFDKLAKGEATNKSQFFREMFRTYQQRRGAGVP